ncbi:MAG: RiPP maturation radical SAM C-methyltransferase [Deltaproteobacteria bacterium]|nr:RiPP maturation radical SAM C-methyltransferase [Deltaproteobacteria bacterium]
MAAHSPAPAACARPRVALVNMPFASSRYPSIQLGLLQAILARHNIAATTHYFNLRFGARLGWEVFEIFCRQTPRLLGDWLFARAAFGESAPDPRLYLDSYRFELEVFAARFGRGLNYLERLRERDALSFVEECLDAVAWDEYDVVGFSSIFAQNTAALALARLLKSRYPRLITIFGGANFEDEMGIEYLRALPWIDYAVTGEGDVALPALLERIASRDATPEVPGVARRTGDRVSFGGRAPTVPDLDQLPDPDYADYFASADAIHLPARVLRHPVKLPYESARGCWWGAKHHCTFCGLNGMGMAYRSKSPARVLAGFAELAARYGIRDFVAVDNILDMHYVREVFGVLADRPREYSFFHEVKANLTREQLELLARGGVTSIQPGIESLNTRLLRLMRKGATAIQNVCLLKWAHYFGMEVLWNLLVGFPGECAEDYERQMAVLRLIPHLPPAHGGAIELHRFSPYYSDAEALGIRNVRPDTAYGHVYPSVLDFDQIAYFFEFEAPDTLPHDAHQSLYQHILWWRRVWGRPRGPFLTYRRQGGQLTVSDGRQPGALPMVHTFDGPEALVHEFCGPTHRGVKHVVEDLVKHGVGADQASAQSALDRFTTLGLMLEEDGRYLSLALPEQTAFATVGGNC